MNYKPLEIPALHSVSSLHTSRGSRVYNKIKLQQFSTPKTT